MQSLTPNHWQHCFYFKFYLYFSTLGIVTIEGNKNNNKNNANPWKGMWLQSDRWCTTVVCCMIIASWRSGRTNGLTEIWQICNSYLYFQPIAFENLGVINASAISLISDLDRKTGVKSNFLFQRLSATLQRIDSIVLWESFAVKNPSKKSLRRTFAIITSLSGIKAPRALTKIIILIIIIVIIFKGTGRRPRRQPHIQVAHRNAPTWLIGSHRCNRTVNHCVANPIFQTNVTKERD